jgi:hypothetical protein
MTKDESHLKTELYAQSREINGRRGAILGSEKTLTVKFHNLPLIVIERKNERHGMGHIALPRLPSFWPSTPHIKFFYLTGK